MTKVVSPFWKSSYSGQENACVEVADTATHGRAIRDSKQPHPEDGSALLTVSRAAWHRFVNSL
ncbi:DUF397 domain-containing protein [Streptomyces sp. N50]|uniref:DUF397 domain-containing protein n=1 Tax=Streptomyces sp. N50 TaxID=3081765 RepID=UPI0029620A5D|nr:DUF397 domain-containing protein [Streptomyces sp. N50]WOX10462.1 DUF397 domain-containing protein [Streptomyces sp. N50]